MRLYSVTSFVLTDVPDRFLIFLTFLVFGTAPFQAHSAADNSGLFDAYTRRPNNALNAAAANQAHDAFNDVLRAETMKLVPSLSDDFRTAVHWTTRAFQPMHSLLSVNMLDLGIDDPATADTPVPAALTEPGEAKNEESPWVSSTSYHHRHGLLPNRDSMMLGSHAQADFLDGYIHADLHPYVAQNYFSLNNFYGSDMRFDFKGPSNGAAMARPWGSISFGYANGEDRLMDHGRGFNMAATLNFSDQFGLSSGISRNDASTVGNYVMLQWTLVNY